MADNDGAWRDEIAGEGEDAAARLEVLQGFDSPTALFNSQQELTNANWRDPFVPEDDEDGAIAKQMERFGAPADYGKSFREQQATLSANKQAVPLGENATEDDIKAFREVNELPMEAADYLKDLPDGMVLGEDDKPIAEMFMGVLHGEYAPAKIGHALIGAYNKMQEQDQADEVEMDTSHHTETTDTLRKDWGSDYRANINIVHAFLEKTFGKDAKEQLLHGRYQDGRGFMNDAGVLKGFAEIARAIDPLAPIVPADTSAVTTLNDEIAEIEALMAKRGSEYWKGPKSETIQLRLRELYDIRTKHEASTKAA